MQKTRFEHIFYEMDMYKETYKLVRINRERILHNALWESHLLHLRNLIAFFNWDHSDYKDDILACRILCNPEGYQIDVKHEVLESINKSVQHLSTYRADKLDKAALSKEAMTLFPIVCDRIDKFKKEIQNPDNMVADYAEDYKKYKNESQNL